MVQLSDMTEYGRKQWVKRKYDTYEASLNSKCIKRAVAAYKDPTNKLFEDKLDKAKWHSTIDKKINYLFARSPVSKEYGAQLKALLPFLKESALEYLLRGSLIWIVQGDGEEIEPRPFIMNNTIAIYSDEERETPICFIRKYTDVEVVPETGEEDIIEYYECYYDNKRERYCYSHDAKDAEEVLSNAPVFIELGKTGDAPLYAYVEALLRAFDAILCHQDTTVRKNTTPLAEVRGYQGSSDEDLEYALNHLNIARVDGNGGVLLHTRSLDSASIELWSKRLLQEYYEATSTVGKDNELMYAQSGKALDRLFIDMEYDAKDLADVLEDGMKAYFECLNLKADDFDIIWNTDRPTDDAEIITGIQQSRGLLSDLTLIEQHPWVDDINLELERLAEQGTAGMEDLVDW